MKKIQMSVRDVINKVTGQSELITQYNVVLKDVCAAIAQEQNYVVKNVMANRLECILGTRYVFNGTKFDVRDDFNPYRPFQKKELSHKIAEIKKSFFMHVR